MKILQLDVNNITYTPVKAEAKIHDDVEKKEVSVDEALVLLISVENGDTLDTAKKAADEARSFMQKQQRKKLVIYPYAHLSSNLAPLEEALKIINYLTENPPDGIEVFRAPFGWNKKLSLDIKGHPLAEQSKSYLAAGQEEKPQKKARPASVNTSIVKKSNWSGLPETDHRTIGEKLDLYSFQEVSPGMVYWHHNGFVIYKEIVRFIREKLAEYNYNEVSTPILANTALWHVSGHIDHYRDEMFVFNSENEELGLKPMGCPSVMLIFNSRKWSYRDLPYRAAEFDMVHRNEVSGALTGLFRVRQITQDDSHTFVREDQIEEEMTSLLRLMTEIYSIFGVRFILKLSTMPDSHLGDEALWEKATNSLRSALKKNGLDYGIKEKDGAFYGPKIDGQILDSMGREWQCLTIQLDYQLPRRFNLQYVGEDGKEQPPVVIHKTIIGSLERFIGILTEHYQGKFPTWLAPTQVKVISISEQTAKYAEKVYAALKENKIRAELDSGDKTMQNKLREAITQKVPYIVILGEKEESTKTITVRCRSEGQDKEAKQKFGVRLEDFIASLNEEIEGRSNKLMY